jgi:hypothetical protein
MPGKNKIVAISTKLETTRPMTLPVELPSVCSPAAANCRPEFDLPHCRRFRPMFLSRHPEINLAALLSGSGHHFFVFSSPCEPQRQFI